MHGELKRDPYEFEDRQTFSWELTENQKLKENHWATLNDEPTDSEVGNVSLSEIELDQLPVPNA